MGDLQRAESLGVGSSVDLRHQPISSQGISGLRQKSLHLDKVTHLKSPANQRQVVDECPFPSTSLRNGPGDGPMASGAGSAGKAAAGP